VINAIMRKRALWSRTAIFLFWDDWGGFYDHVKPPRFVEDNYAHGYGIRVPSILISPWADRGLNVDHGEYSFDSFLRLIEDRFLGGQRLDGSNLDWPDPRPTTREARAGNLLRAFDFQQQPIPRLILDPRPNG
jgi:phospholipase C